jgi:hypothetical protein
MDFDAHFHAFLVSTVNLKPHKLKLLDDRVASIVAAFEADEKMGPLYKEHLRQGSWHTAPSSIRSARTTSSTLTSCCT